MIEVFLIVMLVLFFGPIAMFFIVRWQSRRHLKELHEISRIWAICPRCTEFIYPHHLRCECGHEQAVNPDLLDDSTNVPKTNPCSACGRELTICVLYNRSAICPRCGSDIGRYAYMFQEILIPLLGAPDSGKSAYISALTSQLNRLRPLGERLTFSFPDVTTEYLRRFDNGLPPHQTDTTTPLPPCFTVDIHVSNKKRAIPNLRLLFNDIAGSVYDDNDNYAYLHCLDIMDGAIIFVDPLSIPEIHNKYETKLRQTDEKNVRIGKDSRNVVQSLKEEIYQRTYRQLEYEKRNSTNDTHFFLDGTKNEMESHYAKCAVVLTKSDLFDLDDVFGEAAIQRELRNHPSLSYDEAMDAVCVRLLQKTWNSELQFLSDIFSDVRCFSVSSFGCMAGAGSKFTPQRVERPLWWLLESKYAKILGKKT